MVVTLQDLLGETVLAVISGELPDDDALVYQVGSSAMLAGCNSVANLECKVGGFDEKELGRERDC